MKFTKKYIKELEKKYLGKRIVLDEEFNYGDFAKGLIGTITEISDFGQLLFKVDGGGLLYLNPEDKFHEIYNWEF